MTYDARAPDLLPGTTPSVPVLGHVAEGWGRGQRGPHTTSDGRHGSRTGVAGVLGHVVRGDPLAGSAGLTLYTL